MTNHHQRLTNCLRHVAWLLFNWLILVLNRSRLERWREKRGRLVSSSTQSQHWSIFSLRIQACGPRILQTSVRQRPRQPKDREVVMLRWHLENNKQQKEDFEDVDAVTSWFNQTVGQLTSALESMSRYMEAKEEMRKPSTKERSRARDEGILRCPKATTDERPVHHDIGKTFRKALFEETAFEETEDGIGTSPPCPESICQRRACNLCKTRAWTPPCIFPRWHVSTMKSKQRSCMPKTSWSGLKSSATLSPVM